MKKLLVIFPTRYRLEWAKRAYNSIKENAVCSDVAFCFQKDDRQLEKYKAEFENHIICDNIGLVKKINLACKMFFDSSRYDACVFLADDVIIRTPSFDKILLNKLDEKEKESGHRLWILYWKDGYQDEKLCCHPFVTKELLQLQDGKYVTGKMRHLYLDTTYWYIGNVCKILEYLPEVYIEHMHPAAGKAESDESYNEVSRRAGSDEAEFEKWKKETAPKLIMKINNIISKAKPKGEQND